MRQNASTGGKGLMTLSERTLLTMSLDYVHNPVYIIFSMSNGSSKVKQFMFVVPLNVITEPVCAWKKVHVDFCEQYRSRSAPLHPHNLVNSYVSTYTRVLEEYVILLLVRAGGQDDLRLSVKCQQERATIIVAIVQH